MGFIGILSAIFIGLKLAGVLAWSWLWVLSPIWITVIFILKVSFIAWVVVEVLKDRKD